MEFPAPGAVLKFVWTFEDIQGRIRITQRVSFSGELGARYADVLGPSLATGIPAGMGKLGEAMEAAARTTTK